MKLRKRPRVLYVLSMLHIKPCSYLYDHGLKRLWLGDGPVSATDECEAINRLRSRILVIIIDMRAVQNSKK